MAFLFRMPVIPVYSEVSGIGFGNPHYNSVHGAERMQTGFFQALNFQALFRYSCVMHGSLSLK